MPKLSSIVDGNPEALYEKIKKAIYSAAKEPLGEDENIARGYPEWCSWELKKN